MKQAFLVLSRPDRGGTYAVRVADSFTDAMKGWLASTRISPIYFPALRADDPSPLAELRGKHTLLLVGPAHPSVAFERRPKTADVLLTLGSFNVGIFADGNRTSEFVQWAKAENLRFECWYVRDGSRDRVVYSEQPPAASDAEALVGRLVSVARAPILEESMKEFIPLAASGLARAHEVYPPVRADLAALCDFTRGDLDDLQKSERSEEDQYALLGQLTMVNAALSRFTSQAFSGSTPISDTESHYWTHSLLGTGVANIALWRFCSFIFRRLGEARLPQRLEAMEKRNLDVEGRLEELHERHDWWEDDDLGRIRLPEKEMNAALAPVITCFSGRDGYKSTLQTLSAPLAVIGACNSLRWTLLTITHEVSHIVVRGAMGVLYPRLTPEDIDRACALFPVEPTNMLDAARRYLLVSVTAMHQVDQQNTPVDRSPRAMPAILNRWQREVEELMVHVFDFLYFYGADPEKYVRGIWLSWSVIPNISHRIPEYVLRTLCAVVVNHLRRGAEIETTARDQVRTALEGMQRDGHGTQYVTEALRYLDEHWGDLRLRLIARRGIVRIVRKFLYSPTFAARLREEGELGGGAGGRDGYTLRVGDFSDTPVGNPLRFVETYTQATSPSVLNSMWMLTTLAFNLPTPHATSADSPIESPTTVTAGSPPAAKRAGRKSGDGAKRSSGRKGKPSKRRR